MTHEEYNEFCKSLIATTHVVQWGNSHVWKVGGKVFAIGGRNDEDGETYSFKTSKLNYEILKDEPGFRPAPYLASRGFTWIQQFDTSDDKKETLKQYLEDSHRIVAKGLSKKKQKELGLNEVD